MEVTHAIQILIKGKTLAGPALKEAGKGISTLVAHVKREGNNLVKIMTLATNALGVGFTTAAKAAQVASAALRATFSALMVVGKGVAVATSAMAVGLAGVTAALVGGIVAATKYAASLDFMRDAMWGIAGEAMPAMLDALKEASAFMTTEKGVIREYFMGYMLMGKELAGRIPEAMQYLSKVAAITGDTVEYLTDRLVRSVGRLSTRWMAYIGTVVTMEEAQARAAEMFGKTTDELTRQEIMAGMLDRVLLKLQARTSAIPDIMDTAQQKWAQLGAEWKNIFGDLGTHFLPVARAFLDILLRLTSAVGGLVREGGALYGPLRKISAAFTVLFEILGELLGRWLDVDETVTSKMESFADRIISYAWKAIQWGANIAVNLAAGLVKGASIALTGAMNWIADMLAGWLGPGSAPRIVSNILNWGASAFTEFLRGFSLAQFDVLEGVQAPLKRALNVLVEMEMLDAVDAGKIFIGLSEDLAAALSGFGATGAMGGGIFEQLAEQVGGGYGESIAELLRRQLALADAVKKLAAAEERLTRARESEEAAGVKLTKQAREYNKLVRAGADPAILKAKLAGVEASYDSLVAAREETEEAEKAKKAAEEEKKAAAERVKLQEKLLNQLIMMGEALADLIDEMTEDEEYEMPEIIWPDVHLPPLDQAFLDLKERIREAFLGLWDELKQSWEDSGVMAAVGELGEAWLRFKTEVLAPIGTRLKKLGTLIAGLWDSWATWWDTEGPGIVENLSIVGNTVKGWATEHIFPWVIEEWDKWKAWWKEDGPYIKESISSLGESFAGLYEDVTGEEWSWQNLWDEIDRVFDFWWGGFSLRWSFTFDNLRRDVVLWSALIQGDWETTFEELGLTAENFKGMVAWSDELVTAGEEFIDGFTRGVINFSTNLITTFGNIIRDIGQNPPEMWRFFLIGQQIVDGIRAGIRNKAMELIRTMGDTVRSALRELRRILRMGSPSRVFADIGENMARGLVQGVNRGASDVASAVGRMATGAMGALPMPTTLTPAGVGGAGGIGGTTYYITNQFGKDSVRSEADIYGIAEAIQRSLTLRGIRGELTS